MECGFVELVENFKTTVFTGRKFFFFSHEILFRLNDFYLMMCSFHTNVKLFIPSVMP